MRARCAPRCAPMTTTWMMAPRGSMTSRTATGIAPTSHESLLPKAAVRMVAAHPLRQSAICRAPRTRIAPQALNPIHSGGSSRSLARRLRCPHALYRVEPRTRTASTLHRPQLRRPPPRPRAQRHSERRRARQHPPRRLQSEAGTSRPYRREADPKCPPVRIQALPPSPAGEKAPPNEPPPPITTTTTSTSRPPSGAQVIPSNPKHAALNHLQSTPAPHAPPSCHTPC